MFVTSCVSCQGEFKVTERTMAMKELLAALDAGRILEVFGAGTACVVCPVGSLLYGGQVISFNPDFIQEVFSFVMYSLCTEHYLTLKCFCLIQNYSNRLKMITQSNAV